MPVYTVQVDNSPVDVIPGTLSISRTLNGRSTCEYVSPFPNSTDIIGKIEPGREVIVYRPTGFGTVRLFGGQVHEVNRLVHPLQHRLEYTFTCTDFAQILDRQLAGKRSWANAKAGDILRDLVAGPLAGNGFLISTIQDGPIIKRFEVFNQKCAEVFNSVAELAKMRWFVSPWKEIYFFEPSANPAPFSINLTSNNCRKLLIRPTRDRFINRVVVHLGQYVLDPRMETFDSSGRHGGDPDPDPNQAIDGARTAFSVTYPLHSEPSLTVNGIPKSVGIGSVDTGKDFYWSSGNRDLQQDSAAAPLTPSDVLEVTYTGISETEIVRENAWSIANMAALEHTAGVYEELVEANEPLTRTDGEQLAQALIDARSELSFVATYETDPHVEPLAYDLDLGQIQFIDRAGYASAGDYLIRSMRIQDVRGWDKLRIQVEAVRGAMNEDAVLFFKKKNGNNTTTAVASPISPSGDGLIANDGVRY